MINKLRTKIRIVPSSVRIALIIIIALEICCIASYTPDKVGQLLRSNSHSVRYTINSSDIPWAHITYLDTDGKKVYVPSPAIPFSVIVYLRDGETAEITASPLENGTLVCFIDVDDTLNWRYNSSSGKSGGVRCSGKVGEK